MKGASTIVCLILVVFSSLANAGSKAFSDGQAEAKKDIKSGTAKYLLYGEPQPWDRLLAGVLKEDYHVTLVVLGGCTVPVEAKERADGYNKVMLEHLREESKKDVVKEAEEKARKQWEKEHAKAASGASPSR